MPTWIFVFQFPVKSADFYSTGDILALGTTVGRYSKVVTIKYNIEFWLNFFFLTCVSVFFRWIVLSCESGMHIASFQDGTAPLSDLEYAKGKLHNMHS